MHLVRGRAVLNQLHQLIAIHHLAWRNGHAVARALRDYATLRHIPVVAVTSYAMAGDRERCRAAGCNGYIEKPINPVTFVEEIGAYLDPGAHDGGEP